MDRKLPAFTVPAPIARLLSRLPQLPPTVGLVAALNLALDRVLPREQLEPLLGKRLAVQVTDAGLSLRFTLGARGCIQCRLVSPAARRRGPVVADWPGGHVISLTGM